MAFLFAQGFLTTSRKQALLAGSSPPGDTGIAMRAYGVVFECARAHNTAVVPDQKKLGF